MTRTNSFTSIHAGKTLCSLLLLVLVSAGAAGVLAQQPRGVTNAPSADRLRAHITYLASDKLAGRRTGTSGANLAAEYIAREFARYGLRRSNGNNTPGRSILEADSPRRYWQGFPYVAGVALGNGNLVSLQIQNNTPFAFRLGEDWMPLGFSSNSEAKSSGIAFVGYGISSAELKYDDYAGGVKNRVAIAFAGTPDGDNPHGQFARAGEIRFKAAAARAAGARALLIIVKEPNFKDDRLSRLSYDNAGEGGIPVMAISRAMAAKLLGSNHELSDYEKVADVRTAAPTGPVSNGETTLANAVPLASILRLPPKGTTLTVAIDVVRHQSPSFNLVGILPGSDPKLKNEAIVIGAHYDHLGHGGAGSLAPREGEIHHGADDNASGVAGMLELARIFSTQQPRPKRTLVFIAFSGEEEGLLGSNYYVNHPVVPLASTVAMINMDMIGRLKNNNLIVGGIGTAPEWRSLIESENQMQSLTINASTPAGVLGNMSTTVGGAPLVVSANGRTIVSSEPGKNFTLTLNEDGFGPSDHSSFYAKQVPVLFFWTGTHDDYHKPSDTADKVNYEGETRILSYVARLVRNIDQNEKRPSYAVAKTEATGRSMGFRVYLGTIPNYADSTSGLLLDGVRDDSPAAKAGLKAGDRIVKMAGREVKNVYDYTYSLGEMKAGQEYEVEVMRGSERLSLKITPAARK